MNKLPRLTKAAFVRWIAAQPAGKRWNYYDADKCPLACYLKSLGIAKPEVGGFSYLSGTQPIPLSVSNFLGRATSKTPDNPAGRCVLTREILLSVAGK